jgi:cellobiose phosphorylase
MSSEYGDFSEDGREFIITNPRPPRPWSNVIANPRFGLAVSQSGSGFTWIDNSQLAVVNQWQQDFAQDTSGKFLYVREQESDEIWSLSPAPVWGSPDFFECRHGLGYTTFVTHQHGINAEWTLFAHESDTVEMWIVHLRNTLSRRRSIELTGYLEWCCGVTPAPRREFHKLFIETAFDPQARAIHGWNHMWDVPNNGGDTGTRAFRTTPRSARPAKSAPRKARSPLSSAATDRCAILRRSASANGAGCSAVITIRSPQCVRS